MKKIGVVILTLVSFSFQSNYIQNDISLLCSGKWHLEYIEISEKKIPLPPNMEKNSWAIYYSDGRVEGMDQDGMPTNGKWEYLEETRAIKVTEKEETGIQKIISISDSKLVFSVNQHEQEMIIGFTKK